MDYRHEPDTDFAPADSLSQAQARKQAEALREAVRYHDHLYYVKNAPEISDATYDALFERLQALEEAFPDLRTEDSPTQRVGAPPLESLERVRHVAPMLSLEAVSGDEDAAAFVRRVREAGDGPVRLNLEPKFDGFSVELVYTDGRLERGATRGDGEEGEDITRNLRTVRAIPLRLRAGAEPPPRLAVRGEVFMRRSDFTAVNRRRVEHGATPFANPRNAAAGMMRQLDSREVAGVPFDIFFYQVIDVAGEQPDTHRQMLDRLQALGLKTCPLNDTAEAIEDIRAYRDRLANERDGLDYEIDGIVVKVDELALREALGVRTRNPRWALAWKFPPREEVTRIEDIVVQVGRTGILTPVALLQPVDVGGVTVSRATLHNAQEVHRKDVRVGDRVRIVRAGDVIPEVEERVKEPGRKRGDEFRMPDRCPVCGADVVREGAHVKCPAGLACEAQLVGHLTHYAGRDAMDIEGLGEKTARRLVEAGLVTDLADLYTLDAEDIEGLQGFGETSARQLHDAIAGSRRARLDRFLYALGIPHVGRHGARLLAEHFRELDAVMAAGAGDVAGISGLGEEVAGAVTGFFADQRNRKVVGQMRRHGLEVTAGPRPGGALEGRTFVFTGALEAYTREEAEQLVESRGGRATSGVSSQTDFLVVGEGPGSKLDDARREEVEILDEAGFEALLDDGDGAED